MPSAVVLYGIKESLDHFNSMVNKSALMNKTPQQRPDTSPEWRAKAVALLQKEEYYLTVDEKVAFLDLFEANTAAADIYIGIEEAELRC